jgi:hypothetical protein
VVALPEANKAPRAGIPKSPPYLSGFPILFFRPTDYRPREGAVAAVDLDADGRVELVVSVPSGIVTVIRPDGTRADGWPRTFVQLPQPAYPVGAPGIGDLDGDGRPEIVTCVVSGGASRRTYLYALRLDGSDLPGWPVEILSREAGYYACTQAGVLLADLDGDGSRDVVRVMTGGELVAFDGRGRPLAGWPVRLGPDSQGRRKEINAEMTAIDLEGDGRDEVVFVESGARPRLAAVSGDGRILPGFPVELPELTDRQAPAVGDLDGDGIAEIIQATLPFDGDVFGEPWAEGDPAPAPAFPARLHTVRADGSARPGWPLPLQAGDSWGAILADLDGDRLPEILQGDGADLLLGFDASGTMLRGFPHRVHRGFVGGDILEVSPWVIGDLDGDSEPDLLQARSTLDGGSPRLRFIGLRSGGQPLRGFPFDAEGILALSKPVVADLSADGVGDLVLLAGEGTNGGWRLVAWDLGALARDE